jgi:AraC family transcriptional regulator
MSEGSRSRLEYQTRVNRVVDYIQAHRADDLSLEILAQVAAFSPFHFHRVFKGVTGENLKEFVQRVRLEWAASALLARAGADVTEIALDSGFQSASAFARAFKDRFGMTATEWRKASQADRNRCEAQRKPGEAAGPAAAQDDAMSNVIVKNLPAYHVAYLRNIGPYGPGSGIADLWRRLETWATARDLWTADRVCLGIAHDDPMVTEAAKCRYDAAIVIPAGFEAGGAVNVVDIPGGKHATLEFAGGAHDIGAAWSQLYARWLPQSGYQPEDRIGFELYRGEAWDMKTGLVRCDICVPVRPL